MVPLGRGQAEEPLLEDRVAAVPEGGGGDEELVAVADAEDPVLAPAVGLAPGQVVGEVVPGVAVGAVVLADGRPGAVADVRPPAPPAGGVVAGSLGAARVPAWSWAVPSPRCGLSGRPCVGRPAAQSRPA